jgi:hypothetical protein
MKRIQLPISIGASWLAILLGVVAAAVLSSLYLFSLGGLMPAGSGELYTAQSLAQLSALADNPLLLPYKLLAAGLLQLSGNDLLMVRLAAVAIALASAGLFFLLARRWYGTLNASAATVLFATSSWLLHTGRFGASFGVLILAVLALLNLAAWTNNAEPSGKVPVVYAVVGGLVLFVPGGIWFLAATLALTYRALGKHIREASSTHIIVAGSIVAVLLAGLGLALARDPSLLRQWLGLPAAFPGLIDLGKQAVLSISGFILRGPATPEVWLAHTPVLDAASTVLLLLGVLFYSKHLRNARTQLLVTFAGIGIVLTALHGAPALGYLVPTVYLVLAGGLAFLLHRWKKVFPRNPIAEGAALTAVGILLLCVVSYHMQRYFIAWRYSPNTVQAYRQADPGNTRVPYLIQ